jgi:hypothetical protein
VTPHFCAGFEQSEFAQTGSVSDAARADTITRPDIEKRPAATWDLGDNESFDAIKILPSLRSKP